MMDDSLIAGLCLLCWLNGVCLGWILWRLPKLKEKNA